MRTIVSTRRDNEVMEGAAGRGTSEWGSRAVATGNMFR